MCSRQEKFQKKKKKVDKKTFRQEKFQKKKKKVDKKTFRSCVLSRDPECLIGGNHTEMLISYFCGYGC